MQTNILIFFLGALTFYLISSITGELLDYFKIVDIWNYGEWYCGIPFIPFILIYYFFKNLTKTIKHKCFHPHDKRNFISASLVTVTVLIIKDIGLSIQILYVKIHDIKMKIVIGSLVVKSFMKMKLHLK